MTNGAVHVARGIRPTVWVLSVEPRCLHIRPFSLSNPITVYLGISSESKPAVLSLHSTSFIVFPRNTFICFKWKSLYEQMSNCKLSCDFHCSRLEQQVNINFYSTNLIVYILYLRFDLQISWKKTNEDSFFTIFFVINMSLSLYFQLYI